MTIICEHCKRNIHDTERLLEFDGDVFCTDCFSERVEVYYRIGDDEGWLSESETEEYTYEEYIQRIDGRTTAYIIVGKYNPGEEYRTVISDISPSMGEFNYSIANARAGRSPLVFESKENALVSAMFLALNNRHSNFEVDDFDSDLFNRQTGGQNNEI
ncbi:hypothetical protein LNA66_002486 [Listeria monocytogenes]|nr:hypothetical protein [Listeria monocytogenes]